MAVETDHDFTVSLPSDVITEILSRLPVRSILRFRSVCKSWYALFSDPIFVEKHLKASTENKDYANHRLIFSCYFIPVKSCSITSVLHDQYSTPHPLHYPGRSPDTLVWIVGSVNGLVLTIVDMADLFLWNPATGESKTLPQTAFDYGGFDCYQETAYGFAYDDSSSDYKVVVINLRTQNYPVETEVQIYGLKSNSWRKIDNFHECDILSYSGSGKFVNGVLHWPAWIKTVGSLKIMGILTFDLSEEVFSEILLPYDAHTYNWDFIGVLDGCLSVTTCNFDGTKVDLWVMKEYDKIESWSKMFSLNFQPRLPSLGVCHTNTPLFISFSLGGCHTNTPLFISWKKEVLLMVDKDLVLFDMESNTVHFPLIQDFGKFSRVHTYIETLVSPYH